jgi:two-component system sensor histidine kinase CreC
MYDKGQGVAQDHKQALRWYRKAADQGNASAQYNLGWMYSKGKGVAQDDKQALKWFRMAAEQGEGVVQDHKQAGRWWRKAANRDINHELRGPIAAIRGNVEILQQNMSEADFQKIKKNIEVSAIRIGTLSKNLEYLLTLDDKDNLETEEININEIMENTLENDDISKKIQNKNIKILTKNINKNTFLTVNKGGFKICLSNILNNAIDFSSNNKNIFIESVETKEHVSIKILDEGTGIPKNMINKIQDDYVSMPRPDTNERSTGLGLTIVNKIMDLHNGVFEINNRQDAKGVVVKLTFSK